MEAYQHHGYRESGNCGTLTADQNQSVRGDTPLVIKENGFYSSDGDIAGTLDASYYKGCGMRQGVERTIVLNNQVGQQMEITNDVAIATMENDIYGIPNAVCFGIGAYNSEGMKSDNPNVGIRESEMARTLDLNGGNPACNQGGVAVVQGFDGFNLNEAGELSPTLMCQRTDTKNIPSVFCLEGNGTRESHRGDGYLKSETMYTLNTVEQHAVCIGNGQMCNITMKPIANGLDCMHDQQAVMTYKNNTGALYMDDYKGPNKQYVEQDKLQISNSIVRRLTPLECTRLQGYPDGWVDIGDWVDSKGKIHKDADSPKYKALGNSVALPFWQWMAERMANYLREDGVTEPTMASLFDGLWGFPLVYSRCGCKPVWASEIEEFPIAVTKIRFPEE